MLSLLFVLFVDPFAIRASAKEPIYTVHPIMPDNQEELISNYISIKTKEKDLQQQIEFVVTNKSNETIQMDIQPLHALTSPNGVIQYTTETELENMLLLQEDYGMAQYIEIENELELKPKESKIVRGTLSISDVDSVVLGGVGFQVVEEGKVEETEQVQFKINNEMNTVIGVMVDFQDGDEVVFDIGDPYISVLPTYYGIRLPTSFKSALLMKDVSFKYEVLDGKRNQLFKGETDKIFNFAPHTKPDVLFPWEHEEITKGETYILKGVLSYPSSNGIEGDREEVPFEKEFTYDGNDKDKNDGGLPLKPFENGKFNWWYLLLLLPLLLLLLLLKKKEYVLLSDEAKAEEFIDEEHEDYEKVLPKEEVDLKDYEGFVHYYRKTKEDDEVVYEFVKTEVMPSDEDEK